MQATELVAILMLRLESLEAAATALLERVEALEKEKGPADEAGPVMFKSVRR